MKFLIITHVIHIEKNKQYFAYEPYVREMNIWLKKVDEVIIIAPLVKDYPTSIDTFYKHSNIDFRKVPTFSLTSFRNSVVAFFKVPTILLKLFITMQQGDHIHLRCPGNIGLLACIVQIFFPSKTKTAKYAGNWDPKAKQPWTYRLQRWILSNSFLTRNMKVLVYGEWPGQSQNIMPFFTASYSESEIVPLKKLSVQSQSNNLSVRAQSGIMSVRAQSRTSFLFVGTLSPGKQPLYAIQLVEQLHQLGYLVQLDIYGDGCLRNELMTYIVENNLERFVFLHGNQNQEVLKKAYQQSHFVILASKSEGWPKAIAEGMFWGCVPLAFSVSCVPDMLDNGNRGMLLQMDLENDAMQLCALINYPDDFEKKSKLAMQWSGKFTLERFETEIHKLLQG